MIQEEVGNLEGGDQNQSSSRGPSHEEAGRKQQPAKASPLLSTITFLTCGPQPSQAEPPTSSSDMGNGGWPREETPLPRGGTVLQPEARDHHVVARGEEGHPGGEDSAVGGRP